MFICKIYYNTNCRKMTDNAQKYHAVQGRTHGAGDQDTLAERAARERVYGPIAEFGDQERCQAGQGNDWVGH